MQAEIDPVRRESFFEKIIKDLGELSVSGVTALGERLGFFKEVAPKGVSPGRPKNRLVPVPTSRGRELRERPAGYRATLVALLGIVSGVVGGVPVAEGTFPGENGQLLIDAVIPEGEGGSRRIFLSDPNLTVKHDLGPGSGGAVSPDGTKIAFQSQTGELMLMNADGSGRRVLYSDTRVFEPIVWWPSGDWIGFRDLRGYHRIRADGSDPTIHFFPHLFSEDDRCPEWSADGSKLLYWDDSSDAFRVSDPPLVLDMFFHGSCSRWLPDGEHIVYNKRVSSGRTCVTEKVKYCCGLGVVEEKVNLDWQGWELFTSRFDGSDERQVTDTPGVEVPACDGGTETIPLWVGHPLPSPDGSWIIYRTFAGDGPSHRWNVHPCHSLDINPEWLDACEPAKYWLIDVDGGGRIQLPSLGTHDVGEAVTEQHIPVDWQPIRSQVKVDVLDGLPRDRHSNPMPGVAVELWPTDDETQVREPDSAFGGSYYFDALPPGDYVARVTLSDGSPDGPVFDVLHMGTGDPVWIEVAVEVADADGDGEADEFVSAEAPFSDTSKLLDSNVGPSNRDRLDDMANIFWQSQRFVEWAKRDLAPDFDGQTVHLNLFATNDPTSGPVAADNAYYSPAPPMIWLGTRASRFHERDGRGDDENPENGEWHELTHHLFRLNVSPWNDPSCDSSRTNHAGYSNPDTCDSMNEGFAEFLPTLASQRIDGATDNQYANFKVDLEKNYLPWGSEEDAVASLLWDLYDDQEDATHEKFIQADGTHVTPSGPTSIDRISFGLWGLWTYMNVFETATVADLSASGSPDIDLDGDGVFDINAFDQPFLMHGFYPVELSEQVRTASHSTWHYDVGIATKIGLPSDPRNGAVGRTDHVDADGSGPGTALTPRRKKPIEPGSAILLRATDSNGRQVAGGTVELEIMDAESQYTATHLMATGEERTTLSLPPYFAGPRDPLEPLPPCDPSQSRVTFVSASYAINGYTSADVHEFDSCEWFAAVEATSGDHAMELSFTVPADDNPPVTERDLYTFRGDTDGWSREDWRVILSCTDPDGSGFASGCLETEFRIDDDPWGLYLRPFWVDEEGVHIVEYRSVDGARNTEEVSSFEVRIDRTPPESAVLNPGGTPYPSVAGVPLIATGEDLASGMESLCFEIYATGESEPIGCFEARLLPPDAALRGEIPAVGDLPGGLWFATVELEPGSWEVVAKGTDRVQNVGRSEPIPIDVL